MLVAASTRHIWMTVATVESAAPATAALMTSGLFRTRAPIAPMVAALEMKPDARPAIGSPNRAPSSRTRTYPAALMAITRMTTIQIECGLSASNGPSGRLGSNGSTTRVAPAKINASFTSFSVSTERTK